MNRTKPILQVDSLCVDYNTPEGPKRVLEDVSFSVEPGRSLALVGESGSGKSTTAMAIAGLLPASATVSGEIRVKGEALLHLPKRRLEDLRGPEIAVIFQNPMTSLNPTMRVGSQISEQLQRHLGLAKRSARERAHELMDAVRIRDVRQTARKFPHQLSGGMKQRVMIAMAISCEPDLLLADEPTTALDVTVQAQILEILDQLRKDMDMTLLLVTHDMGVVSQVADQVAVMYGGKLVEFSEARSLFTEPLHPYTSGLLSAQPRIADAQARHRRLPTIGRPAPMLGELPPHCLSLDSAGSPGEDPRQRFLRVGNELIGITTNGAVT